MRLNRSHRSIKVEGEDKIDVTKGPTTTKPEIDHTVGIGMHLIEVEEIMTEILDQDKTTEETPIEIIIGKIMDKVIIGNKGI